MKLPGILLSTLGLTISATGVRILSLKGIFSTERTDITTYYGWIILVFMV
ncbi:hypothetical protein [Metallosphaera javensis (ex Sakai et al. 2022)]|nr:MAG: hypothetical protein MjAS7_0099 [Metallosphaera javensis (ex Sakai et al. 2022)]